MPKLSLAKLERHLYSAADRLRQEGLDAATYKDYIFGLLFLKRCSDVFDAEREKIVGRKIEQGMAKEPAEQQYGENSDFYDTFFVPERARWHYLQSKLADASESYGSVLDKALGALSEHNESLEHVLDHISFMRVQSNKRVVSDDACKDLVRHFNRHRLRNEDFQFSDLLGAAYEFLINMFAESAGKKGGDFYTPRDVIRLMVRILKPQPGLSVYDPTCGSGGMLIISREFVEQSGGDPTNLRLCGQVNDASAWSICRLNMLLHGVPGADIQLADTLLHPQHRDSGELERFDRVIANPPFSQNYTKTSMEFPERFRWGWCPTTGKKGDLMFAQHMLAVCKPNGMVITVMPHGVLFRGGAEKEIRKKFLEQDLIEAVIGLPPNLFYGAGIPACILVMRPNLSGRSPNPNKSDTRRGRVLFINADAEFHAGRAQNYLRSEHVEKIVSTFNRFEDEAITKTEAVIAKLKQVRAGLLHDLLTRGLDEHGQLRDPITHPEQFKDSPLGRIPLEWEVQSLESVTNPLTPICYGIVQAMEFVPDGVPVLTIRDLLGDYSTGLHRTARNIDANYARSRVRPDDVLISVKGTIGRVAVVPQHFQGNISRDLARVRPNDRVRARFLVHLLRSPRGQRILEQAQVGTTRAELSIAPLKRLSFAFPLSTEQERITMVLDEHDALIRSHEHEFEKLGQLKSGLMADLLTGRVRVPENLDLAEVRG